MNLTNIYFFFSQNGQFSGLFLFVGAARMMRPVINLKANKVEYIGSFEQVYMNICINPEEAYEGVTTHMEISKTAFMSNLANLIPMPDCNQSPRNMYQCQMGMYNVYIYSLYDCENNRYYTLLILFFLFFQLFPTLGKQTMGVYIF